MATQENTNGSSEGGLCVSFTSPSIALLWGLSPVAPHKKTIPSQGNKAPLLHLLPNFNPLPSARESYQAHFSLYRIPLLLQGLPGPQVSLSPARQDPFLNLRQKPTTLPHRESLSKSLKPLMQSPQL